MNNADFDAAVHALRAGLVVAIPTDTVYGLAVDPKVSGSTSALFAAKRRPLEVALPVLVANIEQARGCAESLPEDLIARLWPGPLTVIVRRSASFHVDLGGEASTIGLRCPDHDVVRSLCTAVGPLAVSSANRHGAATPTSADAVREVFGNEVAVLIDGGTCNGAPSTVVDCTGEAPVVVRAGAIPGDALAPRG